MPPTNGVPPQVDTFSQYLAYVVVAFVLWLLARERTRSDKVLTDLTEAVRGLHGAVERALGTGASKP